MKKFSIGLPFVALALAVSASAFTAKSPKTNGSTQTLHWFAPNGQYAGQLTRQEADDLCPDGNQICLTPYSAISGSAGEEQPVGSPSGDPVMKQ